MRLMLRVSLFGLIALWTVICIGLYIVLALGEGLLEIFAGLLGAPVGQGTSLVGLVDVTGDIVQWGLGFVWLMGVLVLWYAKRLLTSREERARAGGYAVKAASTAAPYIINKHPVGRAVNMARGPAGKMLGGILARKLGKK